jgi:hypothetical protein
LAWTAVIGSFQGFEGDFESPIPEVFHEPTEAVIMIRAIVSPSRTCVLLPWLLDHRGYFDVLMFASLNLKLGLALIPCLVIGLALTPYLMMGLALYPL